MNVGSAGNGGLASTAGRKLPGAGPVDAAASRRRDLATAAGLARDFGSGSQSAAAKGDESTSRKRRRAEGSRAALPDHDTELAFVAAPSIRL